MRKVLITLIALVCTAFGSINATESIKIGGWAYDMGGMPVRVMMLDSAGNYELYENGALVTSKTVSLEEVEIASLLDELVEEVATLALRDIDVKETDNVVRVQIDGEPTFDLRKVPGEGRLAQLINKLVELGGQ